MGAVIVALNDTDDVVGFVCGMTEVVPGPCSEFIGLAVIFCPSR